jgi:hypothetical protein
MLENQKKFSCDFYPQQFQFTLFTLSRHRQIFIKIFNTLDSILKFSGKKYSLALHLVEMDTDPVQQAQESGYSSGSGFAKLIPIGPDPDPHNTSFSFF